MARAPAGGRHSGSRDAVAGALSRRKGPAGLAGGGDSDNNDPRDERPTDDERSDDMVDTAVDAETALEEAEDAVEDAEDALNASGPEVLPLDDPRIIRAYETL